MSSNKSAKSNVKSSIANVASKSAKASNSNKSASKKLASAPVVDETPAVQAPAEVVITTKCDAEETAAGVPLPVENVTAPAAEVKPELTADQKRAATVAKNRSSKIAERGYALPLVLTCKVTGKVVKYTSPSYIDKVIAKHGSLEKLRAEFTCRDGRAQLKEASKPAAAPAPAVTETPAAEVAPEATAS